MGPSKEDKGQKSQLNIGEIPKQAADAIDELFYEICAMLKKHGREIIPKKMLYAAGLFNWLNVNSELGRKEAVDEAITELFERVENFWKKHGGELKDV